MADVGGVVVAAGRSSRMGGGTPKQYRLLAGRPVLWHTLRVFERAPEIDFYVVVVTPGDDEWVRREILTTAECPKCRAVVPGGRERQESVANGLAALPPCEVVVIHDGVRPFVPPDRIAPLVEAARKAGAATLAVPPKDTVKIAGEQGESQATLPRDRLWLVQTPQAFRREVITRAHEAARARDFVGTDDTSLVELDGGKVALVEGDYRNFKITTPEDFLLAEVLTGGAPIIRTGFGYDVHRLVPGRRLILGGVEIAADTGLLGHSDADVLVHAVMDAALGACGLGDIGRHFPDSDPAYKDISSLALLERVRLLTAQVGFVVLSVDATIVAEAPRLAPFIPEMSRNIAAALGIEAAAVNVKATTTEGLGFAGTGQGMACYAVATMSNTHSA